MDYLNNLYQNIYSDNILFNFTNCKIREIGNFFKFKNNNYVITTNYKYLRENNVYLNIIRVTNDLQYVLFNKTIDRPL